MTNNLIDNILSTVCIYHVDIDVKHSAHGMAVTQQINACVERQWMREYIVKGKDLPLLYR